MSDLLGSLHQWVGQHPGWLGLVIFAAAFAESLAVVGVLVPGVLVMFLAGAMIAAGGMDFWHGVSWAAAGAIAGDSLSFWLGRYTQDSLRGSWLFRRYPAGFDAGVAFFHRHGVWSLVLGRFVGPLRAVIPLVAGAMNMPLWRFMLANITSAFAWALVYLLPGMVFAFSLELAASVAWRLALLLLLSLLASVTLVWLTYRLFYLFQPRAKALVAWLLGWGSRHPRVGRLATALADPHHPEAGALSALSAVLLLGSAAFFTLLTLVARSTGLNHLDERLLGLLQGLRTPWFDSLMLPLTQVADAPVMLTWGLLGALLLYLGGAGRSARYWLAALAFAMLAPPLLKWFMAVPRPDVVIAPPASFAFPSGHTLKATVMLGFWAVIHPTSGPLPRWLPYAIASLLILGVGFSRVYLGVHWPSDLAGAMALGGIWVALLGLAYRRHVDESHLAKGWFYGLAALLPLIWLAYAAWGQGDASAYQPKRQQLQWPADQWQQAPGPDAEAQLIYAGDLSPLKERLLAQGWRAASPFAAGDLLKMISPQIPFDDQPVLPRVWMGRHETLALVRPLSPDQRWLLRLWPSDHQLLPGNQRIWLGRLYLQSDRRYLGLIQIPLTTQPDPQTAPAQLALQAGKDMQFSQQEHQLWIRQP